MSLTVRPGHMPGQHTATTEAGPAVLTHVGADESAMDWEIETNFGRVAVYYDNPTLPRAIDRLRDLAAAHVAAHTQ